MPADDPNRTVPRQSPSPGQTADHVPDDDTGSRAADESSAHTGDSEPRPAPDTPAAGGTAPRTPSDVERIEREALERAGDGVPGYAVLGELGKGGMGVVYKARHLKLNRVVALKMMLGGERVARGDLIRFLAEAEAVAAVRHENVVQVYDYGEAGGRPFMALEYLPGGTLAARLAEGRESAAPAALARDAAGLVARVARGVAAAHALGIVHRDLKPANVLFDEAGTPKVADFGLAKRGEGADVTQPGKGMGTPAYMAPEQARDAKFVGPQADVWALGVVLYEALTGARPFTGSVQEVLARAQNADPAPPRKVAPAVPRDLELICLKCLAKEPHERYPTARELADDLDRYLGNRPISIRPAGPVERASKWVRRNRVVSGAAAAVFLALTAGAGLSLGFGLDANEKAEEASRKQKEADDAAAREEREKLNAIAATQREEKEKREAVAARNELRDKNDELRQSQERVSRMLAKALLGPVGAGNPLVPLTQYEQDAFWQVAELRRDPVAVMFVEEATGTPASCRQLECRAEYAFQAAVGLSTDRRDAADRLMLALLRREAAGGPRRLSAARAVGRWGSASPALAAEAAQALAAALGEEKTAAGRHALAVDLAAAAGRLGAAHAARVCTEPARVLAAALGKERDPDARRELALALAAVAAHADPAEGAKVCREVATTLAALGGGNDPDAREQLAAALAAVAARADPADGARILAEALGREPHPFARRELAAGLAAVATRMDPNEGARMLVGVLADERQPFSRRELAIGLAAATGRLGAADAAKVCTGPARILAEALGREQQPFAGWALAEALAAVASRLGTAEAARVCAEPARALAQALGKARDPFDRFHLAEGLAALAARLEPGEAAQVCAEGARPLAAAHGRGANAEARRAWAAGLAALAPHVGPAEGARLLAAALAKEADPLARRALLLGLPGVAARQEPAEAARALAAGLGGEVDSGARRAWAAGLAAAGTSARDRARSRRVAILAAGCFATPQGVLPSLHSLHPHYHPRPLPAQELVELLKHPFCVGEARRAVLDALAVAYERPFRDQWEFVGYAKKHQPHLDLLTPPRRPQP